MATQEPSEGPRTGSTETAETQTPDELLAEIRDVAVAYGSHVAIEGVSFSVPAGRRIGLIGPNGGGKTTLFRAMLGELKPVRGTLEVRTRCGSVPQTQRSRLDYPVNALDVALMGTLSRLPWWRRPGRAEREQARAALAEVGMADLARELFGELSGGQQQRVLIARALVQDARLLLMDEPFTGVDTTNMELILELIDRLARDGRALLVATHDVDQVLEWDEVVCLNHRQIAFGPPDEVLTPEVLAATYPGSVVVLSHQGHGVHHDEAGEHTHP
jgi:ABC-type Mn2+/Zn2+ transport system ATPase subunit